MSFSGGLTWNNVAQHKIVRTLNMWSSAAHKSIKRFRHLEKSVGNRRYWRCVIFGPAGQMQIRNAGSVRSLMVYRSLKSCFSLPWCLQAVLWTSFRLRQWCWRLSGGLFKLMCKLNKEDLQSHICLLSRCSVVNLRSTSLPLSHALIAASLLYFRPISLHFMWFKSALSIIFPFRLWFIYTTSPQCHWGSIQASIFISASTTRGSCPNRSPWWHSDRQTS